MDALAANNLYVADTEIKADLSSKDPLPEGSASRSRDASGSRRQLDSGPKAALRFGLFSRKAARGSRSHLADRSFSSCVQNVMTTEVRVVTFGWRLPSQGIRLRYFGCLSEAHRILFASARSC